MSYWHIISESCVDVILPEPSGPRGVCRPAGRHTRSATPSSQGEKGRERQGETGRMRTHRHGGVASADIFPYLLLQYLSSLAAARGRVVDLSPETASRQHACIAVVAMIPLLQYLPREHFYGVNTGSTWRESIIQCVGELGAGSCFDVAAPGYPEQPKPSCVLGLGHC